MFIEIADRIEDAESEISPLGDIRPDVTADDECVNRIATTGATFKAQSSSEYRTQSER